MTLTKRQKTHIRAVLASHFKEWDGAFETANYYELSAEDIDAYHQELHQRVSAEFSRPRLVLDDSPHDPPFLKQPA